MAKYKIMDGAMGSELIKRGLVLSKHVWSADANITKPNMVEKIHREYVGAGAEYITTNTFRTTPRAYMKTGITNQQSARMARSSLLKAVAIAQSAAGSSAKIIGSIAPLEDCYDPGLFPGWESSVSEFSQLGKWLTAAGVDILLLETMNSIAETESALMGIENLGAPIWVSFVLKDENHLLSGNTIINALDVVKQYSVDCIMFNCNPLDRTLMAVEKLVDNCSNKWGVYPNLGIGEPSPYGNIHNYEKMDCFRGTMKKIIELEPHILGACCGSSPEHIANLFGLRNTC